ncbi:MAG: TlpA disulfide reductase family protein [candidate division WOR-3 bacterium]
MKKSIGCLLTLIIVAILGYLIYQNGNEILEFIRKHTESQRRLPIVQKEKGQEQPVTSEKTEKAASEYDFTLSTIDGKKYSLIALQDKIILLDFWATWCPPCRRAIPYLCEIYNEYKDKGLIILGISCDQEIEDLRKYLLENEVPYPILIADQDIVRKFEVKAIPALFLFDKNHRLVYKEIGFSEEKIEELKRIIESLISGSISINFFGNVFTFNPLSTIYDTPCSSPDDCYKISYLEISSEFISSLNDKFSNLNIENNPFAQLLFLIELFNAFNTSDAYHSISAILSNQGANKVSKVIAAVAIMNRLGWDINCFYNSEDCYLGINFAKDWHITKRVLVIDRGRQYILKEFDTETPAGQIKNERSRKFMCLRTPIENLSPLPIVNSLPEFKGDFIEKELSWQYVDEECKLMVSIPEEMVHFTKNLPSSSFGMAMCGVEELKQLGLTERLRSYIEDKNEYHQVNFLLKFSQSEGVFSYDSGADIKSISTQLLEGKNDCDGRSVFLYSLLVGVLGYSVEDIVLLHWPFHYALGLKPRTTSAESILVRKGGVRYGDYWVLDPTYTGDTYWGDKMPNLPDECEVIQLRNYEPPANKSDIEY